MQMWLNEVWRLIATAAKGSVLQYMKYSRLGWSIGKDKCSAKETGKKRTKKKKKRKHLNCVLADGDVIPNSHWWKARIKSGCFCIFMRPAPGGGSS